MARRRHQPRCGECGYELRGLAVPRCPECGFDGPHERTRRARLLAAVDVVGLGVIVYVLVVVGALSLVREPDVQGAARAAIMAALALGCSLLWRRVTPRRWGWIPGAAAVLVAMLLAAALAAAVAAALRGA